MKNLIITGRNLTKSYDGIHNILSDVNIEIEAGSKNLIIGESGCGKTTLLSILEGIEQPDSGVLILKDCDMYGMKLQQ
ncbi:ATP-binding cassette domain-containing protein [Eubacterium ventriosum]|jgi:ABC-type Fe3+/spermidine/putrescine transport system ATPase subunit|uniref:ATP-binding cassette domain-containing protein n=1 Tax=Eubacterium ventriosum TaxID=39496 RepID=A0A413TA19_9FIRM|nr:ATP-binding cassette domain-containing protein [Eubacterium ventriosum]RHA16765.1 ATP-binding cassette domain-containing protein [Eubacterium ventriosum]RHA81801.1 ATP-binding cassette domain-containing protein [Eubacterium ventriosum]RHB18415.1 ATP-binding cassette domain-containing protein [Eubacterium ventriosum]RHD13813.1 ATP-binding cassette domain-containing protein [Eubacterium ventriosum]